MDDGCSGSGLGSIDGNGGRMAVVDGYGDSTGKMVMELFEWVAVLMKMTMEAW